MRFGKLNSNRLLGRCCAMFSFADVVHLFAHKFSRLRGRRLSFTGVFAGSLYGLTFGHRDSSLSASFRRNELDSNTTIPVPACARQPYPMLRFNLLRGRRTVLVAHVEFLEMKIKGADQL